VLDEHDMITRRVPIARRGRRRERALDLFFSPMPFQDIHPRLFFFSHLFDYTFLPLDLLLSRPDDIKLFPEATVSNIWLLPHPLPFLPFSI
jgi:hypothetical protein